MEVLSEDTELHHVEVLSEDAELHHVEVLLEDAGLHHVEVLSEDVELHHMEVLSEDAELHHVEILLEDAELHHVEAHSEQLRPEDAQVILVHNAEILSVAMIAVKVVFLDAIVVQMVMFLTIIMVKVTIVMTLTAKILHSGADPIILVEVVLDVIQELVAFQVVVVSSAKPAYVDNKVNLAAVHAVDLVPVLSVDVVVLERLRMDLFLVFVNDDYEN